MLYLKRIWASAGYLFFTFGGLILLVGSIIFTTQAFRTQNQDVRSQAASESQVNQVVTLSQTLTVRNNQAEVVFSLNTHNQEVDGLQLVFEFKAKNKFNLDVSDLSQALKLKHKEEKTTNKGKKLGLIFLPSSPEKPFKTNAAVPILKLKVSSADKNKVEAVWDKERSLALNRQTTTNLLAKLPPVRFELAPPQTKHISFYLQGVTKPNVSQKAQVYLVAKDQKPLKTELEFTSQADGLMQTADLKPLKKLNLNPTKTYQVLVKTPVSLRATIGRLQIDPSGKLSFSLTRQKPVVVGDFVTRPEREWNRFNLSDISAILAKYTQLTQPATASNGLAKFDVNFDQVLDIRDVTLVLKNHTQLEILGD